ncbi:MAG: DUF6580 family putative transport protein [Thermoplasmatota archaeon]|jgi:hypothetical protein
MNDKIRQIIGFLLLVVFAILGRYLLVSKGLQPFPNFEVITIAVFIGIMLLDIRIAMLIPLFGMIFSDILLGNPIFIGEKMNQIVIFTYSGFALLALTSILLKNRIKPYITSIKLRSIFCIAGTGVLLVFLYDVWTNFGWWYIMYPHTGEALITVYSLGVPFMIYHLISGVTTFVLIGLPVIFYLSDKQAMFSIQESNKTVLRRSIPAVVVTLILVIVSFSGCISTSVEQGTPVDVVENVSMKIVSPGWNINYLNVSTTNVTVADFLLECAEYYGFSVKADNWDSYDSLFVEAINDIENGKDGKYWQYYVNGEFANVGCSRYYLKDNDVVEWRFEQSPW